MKAEEHRPVRGERRRLLKTMAAGGIALAGSALGAKARPAPDGLLRRIIPSSGEAIAAVGLGTFDTFDVAPPLAPMLEPVVERFVALGGQVVDSSPMYGRSEAIVGELSARLGLRSHLFLATKVWTRGRREGLRQMEESLRLLRTECLDLLQVHNLVDWEAHLPTLRDWKQQGRIRYLGVTHYHEGAYRELETVLRATRPDFVQLNYSMAEREAELRLLPLAQELGIAVLVNRPFAKAALFSRVRGKPLPDWAADFDCASWAQFFLKFILARPAVTCVIPATGKPEHVEDNLAAARGRLPDVREQARMVDHLARV
ncbi:aldo/keto reductase [Accumulibacter sp.]|uniref:aldo/keto reductase n=1 Tax=Accumulibacter sp. TaxID=2053492 RepID=UPI0025CE6F21|nr:aldo/keto reductase [Accumulibacter sp.]MCM8594093.1 aldo/keto reductase [Accumulibacter sp.]MCM8624502.1 aldo/keto reductase [Accumulibacter sp.]MDS4048237.1 aldo/keto reductase [Accumulibacter sp.]